MEDNYFPPMMASEDSPRSWGGSWTEQKLDTFESYVRAYLTIMNAYRDKFHWKLIYFDGFAGSSTELPKNVKKMKRRLLNYLVTIILKLANYPFIKVPLSVSLD